MSAENFVSKDKVAEESSIRIREVETFLHDNIGIVSEISVERIILEFWCVKVCTCMFVNSVISHDSLEKSHCKIVRIIVTWNHKRNSNTQVWQFVISSKHQGWSKEWLFAVVNLTFNILLDVSEMLIYGFVDGCRVNIADSRHHNIISNIVFRVELFDLFGGDRVNIISNTCDGLS